MSNETPFHQRRIFYEIAGMDRVQIQRDLVYTRSEQGDLTLDVYMPPDLPQTADYCQHHRVY